MNVFTNPGHTVRGKGTGAKGYICESTENRIMVDLVNEYLRKGGAFVKTAKVDEANNYLELQVRHANNAGSMDVVVQIHFNAGGGVGTEVLYTSSKGKVFAERVVKELSKHFKNRGAKKRTDLYWLNNTKAPSILIEICFVDSKSDTDYYKSNKRAIAKSIAEGIIGKEIREEPSQADIIYQVVLGSYRVRENADNELSLAKSKGFKDAFIQVKK